MVSQTAAKYQVHEEVRPIPSPRRRCRLYRGGQRGTESSHKGDSEGASCEAIGYVKYVSLLHGDQLEGFHFEC